ncbi:uncharacterized protein B0T15DRAFT_67639 [Chaetomium strumarium]|uniref:Uncharacterized protein n=1 Tax=Chaetomium strumarium TaxID=1170767 RepID=A0AAJ0H3P2_9PEZI|nr:hypothetical protein B0T15DRAFT_67639 [Chaetomium strumarium]
MDFQDNALRKRRCDTLVNSMDSAMLAMNRSQSIFESKSDWYQEIVLRGAQAKGYPTIEALKADMVSLMEDVDKTAMDLFDASQEGMSKMYWAVGGLGILCLAVGAYGTLHPKVFYGEKLGAKKANKVTVLKNALTYRLTVSGPRELKVKRALGIISDSKFNKIMGDASRVARMVSVQNASEFAKGGKFADAPIVMEAAKTLKRLKWVTRGAAALGILAEGLALGADAAVGEVVKGKLREAIHALAAQRFAMKKQELLGRVYDTFNEQVASAVSAWVNYQDAADEGSKDYHDADKALENALDAANQWMYNAMADVCDCKVLEECAAEDKILNAWTNEDPSYRQILELINDDNTEPTDVPECEIHHPTGKKKTQPLPQESAQSEIYPTLLQGSSAVTASNCRYVELNEGKGCLWRIRGTFWTFQQAGNVNTDGEPQGLNTSRIRLQERRRTSDKIYLQNIKNWSWNEVKGNWDPPARDQLFPFVVLNFANGKLETLPGSISLDSPGSAAPWGGRTMDPNSYSNLAHLNGWTLYYVPAVRYEGQEFPLDNAHEQNKKMGWKYTFPLPAEDPEKPTEDHMVSGLLEVSRSKDRIDLASKDLFTKKNTWPKASVDVATKRIVFQQAQDNEEMSYDIETVKDMWKARMNFT